MGSKEGIQELKKHAWFKDFDWESLKAETLASPFKPSMEDNLDVKHIEKGFRDRNRPRFLEASAALMHPQIQKLFEGFYFDEIERLMPP